MKNKMKYGFLAVSCLLAFATLAGCNNNNNNNPVDPDPVVVTKTLTIEGATSLKIGDSTTLVAKCEGEVVSGVSWSSSNSKVAMVDAESGEVLARTVGSVTISAKKDGYTAASITLTISNVDLIDLKISGETSVKVGETITLAVATSDGNEVSGCTWTSSDTNVAIVSSAGLVRGLSEGNTVISASKDGYNSAVYAISVVAAGDAEEEVKNYYAISYPTSSGLTFDGPKSAKEGESVSFKVTNESSYTVINSIKMNGTELTGDADGNYSFTMPATTATITVSTSFSGSSNVFLSGGVDAPFEYDTESGLYKANKVKISGDGLVDVSINYLDSKDTLKTASITTIDGYNSFAYVENAAKTGTFATYGGSTYDFTFDPNTLAWTINRSNVDVLPTSIGEIGQFFMPRVSFQSMFARNVASMEYSSVRADENYQFTRWDNGSYAKVTPLDSNEISAEVYKNIENKDGKDYLRVVDTYVESDNYTVSDYDLPSLLDSSSSNTSSWVYANSSKYSGLYNIVDSKDDIIRDKRYSTMTKNQANMFATLNSHDYYSMYFDLYDGTSVGGDIFKTFADAGYDEFEAKETSDGKAFTVHSVAHETITGIYEDGTETASLSHRVYTINLTIDKTGRLLNGNYKYVNYGESEFDFTKLQFKSESAKEKGTIVEDMNFSYTYSDDGKYSDPVDFDYTPYFTQSIKVTINNPDINDRTHANMLKKGDYISGSKFKKVTSPSSALDSWQYRVTSSSNESNIAVANDGITYYARYFGDSTLTISNGVDDAVKDVVDVNVYLSEVNGPYGFWFDSSYGNPNYLRLSDFQNSQGHNADWALYYAGETVSFIMRPSPSSAFNGIEKFEYVINGRLYDSNGIFNISYDAATYTATFTPVDGWRDVLTSDTLDITVRAYTTAPSTKTVDGVYVDYCNFYVEVMRQSVSEMDAKGTWRSTFEGHENYIANLTDEYTTETITRGYSTQTYSGYKGTLTTGIYTCEFLWWFDTDVMYHKAKIISSNYPDGSIQYLYIDYDPSTGYLGFSWYQEDVDMSGSTIYQIVGGATSGSYDEDDQDSSTEDSYAFEDFEKISA